MFKKLKENKKKGFTLVELIVVLVILAILAALLIPALTGYIDKARNKSVIAETRQVVMATQTLVDEKYAKGAAEADVEVTADTTSGVKFSEIYDLADIDSTKLATGEGIQSITAPKGKVATVVYKKNGKTCTYTYGATNGTDGAYNVE